ncbi:hypothetical protein AB5J62_14340 [Amycolatopsis sp. cg5]|uniref:hypothetical protein n=1 Tax=Amycolatopsis sp. cg5 TaxID=3238802 RepID=UPI003524A432
MTEDQVITRPMPLRLAFGLWIWAVGLTLLVVLLGLVHLPEPSAGRPSGQGTGVLGSAIVLVCSAGWTLWQYHRGLPLARVVLAGLTVYFGWTLIVDAMAVGVIRSDFPGVDRFAVVVELVRVLSMIVAVVLSFTPSAHGWFRRYESGRHSGAKLAAWFWVVREFRFGRRWARVTLLVTGAVCAAFEVAVIVDASTFDTPAYVTCAVVQLMAFAAAVVLSFVSPAKDHFRVG